MFQVYTAKDKSELSKNLIGEFKEYACCSSQRHKVIRRMEGWSAFESLFRIRWTDIDCSSRTANVFKLSRAFGHRR